jgi:hypothetical protein
MYACVCVCVDSTLSLQVLSLLLLLVLIATLQNVYTHLSRALHRGTQFKENTLKTLSDK